MIVLRDYEDGNNHLLPVDMEIPRMDAWLRLSPSLIFQLKERGKPAILAISHCAFDSSLAQCSTIKTNPCLGICQDVEELYLQRPKKKYCLRNEYF